MSSLSTRRALLEVAGLLQDLLGSRASVTRAENSGIRSRPDAVIRVAKRVFHVERRASGDVASVTAGLRELAGSRGGRRGGVALLVVPFMGEAGQRLCRESDVSWLDLSGNARIVAPGIHVHVEGKENRFKRRGRPSDPFAPKSARVARWLLVHPDKFHVQQELAAAIGLGAGFVSRIVRRLEQLGLIERDELGAVRAHDARLLREAWGERYEFERHSLLEGHVAARSGEELLAQVSKALARAEIEHAVTGLAGAWLHTHFAAFRSVAIHVVELPSKAILDELGFHEGPRGANLRLALPRDEGVFLGAEDKEGVCCAHPVQVWLDLKGQGERSEEAARHLATRSAPGEARPDSG